MTYFDEVLCLFVDDVSLKLNIDLSWILQQGSKNLLDMSIQYCDELQDVSTTKSGGYSQNPNLSKKMVEVQDGVKNKVNRTFINSDIKYEITEYLNNLKQQGVESSVLVDNLLVYKNILMNFSEIATSENVHYKSIKSIAQLAAELYLRNNEKLVVPLKSFEKAKAFWEHQAELGDIDAQAILKKLIVGQISKSSVLLQEAWIETVEVAFPDEEKIEEYLQNLADHFLMIEFEISDKENQITYEMIKRSNVSLKQLIIYMVRRCLVEIRQACKDQSIDFSSRLQNVIDDTKSEFKEILEQHLIKKLSKSVIDYIAGLIVGFYKNIHQAIQKGGKYFKIICDEMWLFVTGKNTSLFQTILNISKAIAALAVFTFIVGLHQYLTSMGISEVFVVIITAFISALVTVAIFRLIERAAQLTGSVFYTRDVARIRRQEVERICEEVLPIVEEQVAQIDILIEQVDQERGKLFNRSFVQIKDSLTSIEIDQIVLAYQGLYQYLEKDLPFRNKEEFDDFMIDGRNFVL